MERIAVKEQIKSESVSPSVEEHLKTAETPNFMWQKNAEDFIQLAHSQLLSNPEQLAWLKKFRGIGVETAIRFKLGWNDKDRYYSRSNWYLQEFRTADGRFEALWLPRGLVIPCHSFSGELLRLTIRRPDSDMRSSADARYIFICGDPVAMGFFGHIRSVFMIVQSELDAILLHQEGGDLITPVSIGRTMSQFDQTTQKLLSEANKVMVSFDNDQSGLHAAILWSGTFSNSHLWPVLRKYGKDHAEALRNGLDLRFWLKCGIKADILRNDQVVVTVQNPTN